MGLNHYGNFYACQSFSSLWWHEENYVVADGESKPNTSPFAAYDAKPPPPLPALGAPEETEFPAPALNEPACPNAGAESPVPFSLEPNALPPKALDPKADPESVLAPPPKAPPPNAPPPKALSPPEALAVELVAAASGGFSPDD